MGGGRIGRLGWGSNGNGWVIYNGEGGGETVLDADTCRIDYPKAGSELTQEIEFQRRKQLAIKLRETNIPFRDRKAYKQKRGFTGSR
ncbi:hypothetical protein [Acinetobacter pittii]|uniref:hypothetical protein n=1 Tax=Acinetobacter pittii TaxID=48296 RepID=UPI003AF1241D|nr:hypothetical protein [Acinetobacter pittii]